MKYPGHRNRKKPEPVSSTSRRGTRVEYHDEYPRDFGPRIAYTVSLVSDTSRSPTLCRPPIRQGEKCRPQDHMRHIPFIHQLCSHPTLRLISVYIQKCSSYLFHVVLTLGHWNVVDSLFTHALFQS